jgi:uncharacterized DUF497 family protein
MSRGFRWNDWNRDHATAHGVSVHEIETLVRNSRRPERVGGGKVKIVGRGPEGQWLQVIYLIGDDDLFFVIHARPLTDREKKRERRR